MAKPKPLRPFVRERRFKELGQGAFVQINPLDWTFETEKNNRTLELFPEPLFFDLLNKGDFYAFARQQLDSIIENNEGHIPRNIIEHLLYEFEKGILMVLLDVYGTKRAIIDALGIHKFNFDKRLKFHDLYDRYAMNNVKDEEI